MHTFLHTLSLLPSLCLSDPLFSSASSEWLSPPWFSPFILPLIPFLFYFLSNLPLFSLLSLPSLYLFPSTCCFWVRRCALISWKLQSSSRKSTEDEKNLTPQLSTVLIKCAKCSHNYKNLLSEIRCPVVNHERNNDVCISVIICGSRLLVEGKWHSLVLPDMLRLLSDTEAPLTSWHCWVHHVPLWSNQERQRKWEKSTEKITQNKTDLGIFHITAKAWRQIFRCWNVMDVYPVLFQCKDISVALWR